MKRCKITAIRKTEYKDLMEKYENPMENACDIEEGQVFIAEGWKRPEGFCESAWESISPFVMTLVYGGSDIYEGWMKNKKSAMISCMMDSARLVFISKCWKMKEARVLF